MTNRINAFVVILDNDVREDDAQSIQTALQLIKGVVSVEANVSNVTADMVANARVRARLESEIVNVIRGKGKEIS